jgi:para-nitrobenzyl esterase
MKGSMMMNTEVRVEQGRLRGVLTDGTYRFRGIPYAAPPVGERRWRAPAPAQAWSGVRDATAFGNVAIQTANAPIDFGAPQSEDCLYLNVWTESLDRAERQPVMLWIHGGGFIMGASSMPDYDPTALAALGVTVVSINYRLGAFGFLAHPDSGTNFAVQDWVAALQWVATNITAFGGDPGNVTIFGQSAGAVAVRALLSTPSARGLFHRGIMQSAGFDDYAVVASPSYERAEKATAGLLARFGCVGVEELRGIGTKQLQEASLISSGSFPPAGQLHTPANLVWYPVVDDQILDGEPGEWSHEIPVLLGCTEHESRYFVRPNMIFAHPQIRPEDVYTDEMLGRMAAVLAGPASGAVLDHLTGRGLTPYQALASLITTAIWHEPAVATATNLAGHDRALYHYRFSRVSPGNSASGMLAYHSAEIPYLFGTFAAASGFDEIDRVVAEEIRHAWVEFARHGAPRSLDGAIWPAFSRQQENVTVIDESITSATMGPDPVSTLIAGTRAG